MKKYFLLSVVIVFAVCGVLYFVFNDNAENQDINNSNEFVLDVVDELQDEIENNQKIEETVEPTIESEILIKSEEIVNSTSDSTTTNAQNEEIKQASLNNEQSIVEQGTQEVVTKAPESSTQPTPVPTPAPTQPPVLENPQPQPTVDTAYEEELKKVEYATYDEALNAGFDISFADSTIISFDVRDVYYGGEIIGYRLVIHRDSPLE